MDKIMERIVAALKPFFDQIQVQFDRIDARFAQVDARFAQVDVRFDQIEVKFDARFDAVDKDLHNTKMAVTKASFDLAALRSQMVEVDQTLATAIQGISRLDGKFDDFSGRSALHAETLLDHDKRLRRLEEHRA